MFAMLDLLDTYFPNSLILLRYNVIIDIRNFLYGWRIALEMAQRCGLPNRQVLGKLIGLRIILLHSCE
jgi:hypothetical protein